MKIFRGAAVAAAIAGSMLSVNAQAVNLATDGIGEVAIAPYYTVRDGWTTLINLTNTQNANVIVKVRFHEAQNSRDVLDFNVALSPYDVWTAVIKNDDTLGAVVESKDTANASGDSTCTIPSVVGQNNFPGGPGGLTPMQTSGFSNPSNVDDDDQGQEDVDRLREGYIEFIVMGYTEPGSDTADVINPANGIINIANAVQQHDCDALDDAFTDNDNASTNDARILETARQMGEPINALKFNFRLLNGTRGVEAGNAATTWANFFNPRLNTTSGTYLDAAVTPTMNSTCTVTRGDERTDSLNNPTQEWYPDQTPGAGSCINLITAQQDFAFLEPSLNDAWPVVANFWDDQSNNAVSVVPSYVSSAMTSAGAPQRRGVDAVSATIMRQAVMNEWSSKSLGTAGQAVSTDWIITQPTKGFYVDQDLTATDSDEDTFTTNNVQAAIVTERQEAIVVAAGGGNLAVPYLPYPNAWKESSLGAQDAKACATIGLTFFDRAEQQDEPPQGGVIISPAPPVVQTTNQMCYESNRLFFNGETTFTDAGSVSARNRLASINPASSSIPNSPENGWMFVTLDNGGAQYLPIQQGSGLLGRDDAAKASVAPGEDANALLGLPVIGFNLKVRATDDSSNNYASTLDHGFIRYADEL